MHIPRVQARREIATWNATNGKLTGERIFHLVLAATEDEDEADKQRARYFMDEMRAGRTPEVD